MIGLGAFDLVTYFCPFAIALTLENTFFLKKTVTFWALAFIQEPALGSLLLLTGPWQNIWSDLFSETQLPAV